MKNRTYKLIVFHLLFWSFNWFIEFGYWEIETWKIVIDESILICLFYFNYFFLAPKIIRLENNWTFLYWALSFLLIFEVVMFSWHYFIGIIDLSKENQLFKSILFNLHITFFFGWMSLALRLAKDWLENEDKNKDLNQQKTALQIQYLKSNINIPFMRKTLQWMSKNTKENSDLVENGIIQLSDLLRYSLYRTQKTKVKLSEELEMVGLFLDLRKVSIPKEEIKLSVGELETEFYIMPNFLVRSIGNWMQHTENETNSSFEIQILQKDNCTRLVFPEISNNHKLEEDFQNFKTDDFDIKTIQLHPCLIVSIQEIKHKTNDQ